MRLGGAPAPGGHANTTSRSFAWSLSPGLTCTWAIFPSTVLLTTVSIFTTAPGIGEPR